MDFMNQTISYIPDVLKHVFYKVINIGESVLWPMLLYFTAFPFLMRYIIIPAFNRAIDGYKHTKKWEQKMFSTHVTGTLYVILKLTF